MMGRNQQQSKSLRIRMTAREMAIGSSGGTSYHPEYYRKSENGMD